MYKIYGWKLSGSLATEAALKEAGADYEIIPVNIRAGEQHEAEYGRINPRRQVPALALPDGSVMTEGAAILLHIADVHQQSRLAPPPMSAKTRRASVRRFPCAVEAPAGLEPVPGATSMPPARAIALNQLSMIDTPYP